MFPFVLAAEEIPGPDPAKIQDILEIVKRILNIAVRLAGIAVFVMLIVGGFQYLTAGGDPKKTQAAGSTITYAIFGLIALIILWFIFLLISKFSGIDVTKVELPTI